MPPSYVKAVESHSGGSLKGLRWRYPDDRLLVDPRASACRQRPKKATRSRCMGRSRGGLPTKIHVLVDACGLPILLKITEGQAHDGRNAQDSSARSAAATCLWPIVPMTPMLCVRPSPRAVPEPTSELCRTVSSRRASTSGSIESAIWSRGSSTNSSISAPSQHDTTNATIIISPQSNSRQSESGCALMSRQPSALLANATGGLADARVFLGENVRTHSA